MNRVLFTLFAAEPEPPALTRSPSYLALPDLQVFSWQMCIRDSFAPVPAG